MEQGPLQHEKSRSLRSTKVGAFQQKGFKGHVATDGSVLALQESGKHVVGPWCNWTLMEHGDLYMECMAQ